MRRRERDLSCRERGLIDSFIREICRDLRLSDESRDLYQCAWVAFLSVHRDSPASFCRGSVYGWDRAYLIIWDTLERERSDSQFWRYKTSSLDQPVSGEIQTARSELVRAPHGDFQNSVCLHDYLRHMERDVRHMAYGLIAGDTKEEVGVACRWNEGYTTWTYCKLRSQMEEYWKI